MFGWYESVFWPYSVISASLSVEFGSKYSFDITTKLLYSSKNIAVWVATASLCKTSATVMSGSTKK